MTGQKLWDDRYRESDRIWSGNPDNAVTKKRGDVRARCGAAYVTALRRSGVSR